MSSPPVSARPSVASATNPARCDAAPRRGMCRRRSRRPRSPTRPDGDLPSVHEVPGRRHRSATRSRVPRPAMAARRAALRRRSPQNAGQVRVTWLTAPATQWPRPEPGEYGREQVHDRHVDVAQQHQPVVDAALGVRLEPGRVGPCGVQGVAADQQPAVGLGTDRRGQHLEAVEQHRLDPAVRPGQRRHVLEVPKSSPSRNPRADPHARHLKACARGVGRHRARWAASGTCGPRRSRPARSVRGRFRSVAVPPAARSGHATQR